MTDWRPSSGPAAAARRSALLARAREYFDRQGVLAVDTPALVSAGVTDPNIESIPVDGGYLHTSPEFAMKRLLAAGYPDIYSICRVFRAGERGRRHLREFTMIEWYRRDFGLDAIIADTLALIRHVLGRDDVDLPATVIDYREAFVAHAGVDPLADPVSSFARAAGADDALAETLGDDRDAWLDLLMTTRIGPALAPRDLTVIRHYPASQAALARLCPANPRVADRFEVYAGDLELANGYVELTDAARQAARMDGDNERRRARRLPPVRRDEGLLAALKAGLPPCAGVALGAERLHMLAAGAPDIRDVITFEGDVR